MFTSETVTFFFTDIEGSTQLWEQHPDAMRSALAEHDSLMRQAIETQEGTVFKTMGDAFCAAFASPAAALSAALTAQQALQKRFNHGEHGEHEGRRVEGESSSQPSTSVTKEQESTLLPSSPPFVFSVVNIRVRMALHTGLVEARDEDYFGPPVNRVARLLSAGHGGQILLSDALREQVQNLLPPHAFLLDLGRYPLKDLPAPERIWMLRHPDLPSEFPPLRTQAALVHGMPQTLTSFIGRTREAAMAETLLLQPEARLVTLTGFGGMGKSRLAMRVADQCLAAFPDGAWWIELEGVRSAAGMWARLAETLRLTITPGESARDQTCRNLRDRSQLLVLDNTEQIADAGIVTRDLLASCPGLKCLAATRRALGLRGERTLEVLPMETQEAATLFLERAREVKPDLTLTDANQADVIELCRRLDGQPLALELAAARSAMLTPSQILARLNERFRLLQSRSPDLPPRQRALRAAIEYSYDLLDAEERTILAQLSVFEGGFTLEDAEAVYEGFDVFSSIEVLWSHSFFRVETHAESQVNRYAMLESVREFADEQLQASGEAAQFAERHANRFLERSTMLLAQMRTEQESEALRGLEQDGNNLRAATRWARETGNVLIFAQLSLAVGRWRQKRGFLPEAVTRIQDGLDALHPQASAHPLLLADLLRERAGLHLDFSETSQARICGEEARELSAAQADNLGEARAENLLAQAARLEKQFEEARERFQRALKQFADAKSDVETANVLNNLGMVERQDRTGDEAAYQARLQLAEQHYEQSRKLRIASGDRRGLAETLTNMGVLAFERDDLEQAEKYYREALEQKQDIGDLYVLAVQLFNLGEIAQKRGEHQEAVRRFACSEFLFEEMRSPQLAEAADMTTKEGLAAQMSSHDLAALRAEIHLLSPDQLLRFALSAELPEHD